MAKKTQIELDNYYGAICVLENYLFGAVADYENGDVENDSLIWDSIRTIELLYTLSEPILLYGDIKNYRERMERAKERRNTENVYNT